MLFDIATALLVVVLPLSLVIIWVLLYLDPTRYVRWRTPVIVIALIITLLTIVSMGICIWNVSMMHSVLYE